MKALLLDIEGTTTPISFVTETLFPYAEAQYATYIEQHWSAPDFAPCKQAFAAEDASLVTQPASMIAFVRDKHAKNEKHTAFKSLQGALWQSGYEDGSLKSSVYDDVVACMERLSHAGTSIYIYSSGSIAAQKLLFRYSDHGNLTPFLQGYFDLSTAGPKTSAASYTAISRATHIAPQDWLFLSDNVREVAAAKEAGMASTVVERPGNAPVSAEDRTQHSLIHSFAQL